MLGCPEMLGLLWRTPRVGECVLVLGMLEILALPLLMAATLHPALRAPVRPAFVWSVICRLVLVPAAS